MYIYSYPIHLYLSVWMQRPFLLDTSKKKWSACDRCEGGKCLCTDGYVSFGGKCYETTTTTTDTKLGEYSALIFLAPPTKQQLATFLRTQTWPDAVIETTAPPTPATTATVAPHAPAPHAPPKPLCLGGQNLLGLLFTPTGGLWVQLISRAHWGAKFSVAIFLIKEIRAFK